MIVVVTGASAGVGRAVARQMARRGVSLALVARGEEGLEAARQEAVDAGAEALALPCDVADADAVEEVARRVEDELGPIDVWINNAMVTVFGPIDKVTPREFERVTQVTYLGTVYGTMAALRRMRPRDRGTILQVGSALAYRSIPLQSAYCGAKHAMVGFTEAIRCELLHDRSRVHVGMVHLPAMDTPQFDHSEVKIDGQPQPVPPIYRPEVAAKAIAWAARHRRRELWVGGPTVKAIIGERVIPGRLDRYLGRWGYEAQFTGEELPADHASNLWAPIRRDEGAHGRFGAISRRRSPGAWLARHPWAWLAPVALVAAGIGLGARRLAKS